MGKRRKPQPNPLRVSGLLFDDTTFEPFEYHWETWFDVKGVFFGVILYQYPKCAHHCAVDRHDDDQTEVLDIEWKADRIDVRPTDPDAFRDQIRAELIQQLREHPELPRELRASL